MAMLLRIIWINVNDRDMKRRNFTRPLMEKVKFLFLNLDKALSNSNPEHFAIIWQILMKLSEKRGKFTF